MNKKKILFVIDGNSLLNREYYALAPHTMLATKNGTYTNGVLGFTNKLIKYIETFSPDYRFAAFDLKSPTFRHAAYKGYKSSRKGMPEELASQMPYAKEVCEILGFTVLTKEGFEADDILGTLSKRAEEHSCGTDTSIHSYILTGDRDALQLVSEYTTVLLATNNAVTEYTPEKISEKYGILPRQLIDVKALMGDTSDEIPGIKGIGEKTALKLIAENNSLDELYNNLDSGALKITPSNREKLVSGRESAYLSRKLAEICSEVPDICIGEVSDLSLEDIVNNGGFYNFCQRLEFNSIIKRLGLRPTDGDIQNTHEQFLFHQYSAVDISAIDGKFEKDEILFVTFDFDLDIVYVNNGIKFYKAAFENLSDIVPVIAGDYKICTDKTKDIYLRFLQRNIDMGGYPRFVFDFQLAGYVLNPAENRYKIADLLSEHLGYTGYAEYPELGEIAESDSGTGTPNAIEIENQFSFELYNALCAKIKELELEKLYYDIELPLALILAEMEHRGFLLDREGILEYGKVLDKKSSLIQGAVYDMSGRVFNINSPKQLGEILFECLKLPHGRKNKTGYSTNADVMEKLKSYHPIVQQILDYRAVAKLKSTYCDGLIKLVDGWNRRLHTSFNQTVTATGRLSSTEPNLQNIPVRTPLGKEIRKFFIADDNFILIDADYSQIELRVLAHISGDETLINAFNNNIDIHKLTASQVFGVAEDQVTPEMRNSAKAVNFGIVYGISDFSLSEDIGVTVLEAREYIKGYFSKYPKVKEFMDNIAESARKSGYVKTMFNRIRYIPELKSSNKNIVAFGERIARNTPVQGSAADIIKLAMIACDRKFKSEKLKSRLILQVHDELIIEAPKDEAGAAAAIIKAEMENVVKMSVPLVADVSMGESWYNAKG